VYTIHCTLVLHLQLLADALSRSQDASSPSLIPAGVHLEPLTLRELRLQQNAIGAEGAVLVARAVKVWIVVLLFAVLVLVLWRGL
jgi:hypothetical protein